MTHFTDGWECHFINDVKLHWIIEVWIVSFLLASFTNKRIPCILPIG